MRAAVTFEFDADGDIVRASAVRKRQTGKQWEETPWGGEFGEYEVLGGIRMPTVAEVDWVIEGAPFVYRRGVVLTATPNDPCAGAACEGVGERRGGGDQSLASGRADELERGFDLRRIEPSASSAKKLPPPRPVERTDLLLVLVP